MKAAQWDPMQKKVVVNTVPVPEPGEGQFLIRLASASLCHSDLMSIAIPGRTEPITLGHEGAGYIEAVHPSAEGKGFKVGDAVGFLYVQGGCYECKGCLVHNNHCMRRQSQVNGFTIPGFFAEYNVVDWQNCIILPPAIDVRTASPMFCAGITSFHCIDSCELKPNDWIVIIGCGGLGQLAIQYAKAMGARVIGLDVNDDTLQNSKAQGADLVFNSRTDPNYKDEILRVTDGGAQAVAVFSAAEAAYDSATPLIEIGGILMVVGLPAKGIRLDALDVARGTYRVKGDSTSTPQRMPKAIDFTVRHGIKTQVEVHTTLDAVPDMVERMQQGKSTKKMVVCL
ncbi:alcohol dehydrogenase [Niveomyces insectorum RCEF 264]|uniref:Alcohol dehydrogenase n=1 Tax=Niveomyces insectorum RCEF 264 TaxID=1081102 RepID=A0A167Q8M6_9HYPO|nr:alcohol dehydrogenase [Niveomyces insectorum RCEF 264]